jgi:Asp-tRNA(Asn)/Glu-tRNA(Gln) amidotransferase A subunit family amidase
VKDLFRVTGLPTRAGSRLPPEVFEGDESWIVTELKRAGAVVLGKTAMDEFAYCEPPPTRNPRDARRTPGGSSGGSAAAVAAGICRLAVGSQTLQSVVVPAAYCGAVGFKASFERLPFDGIPLAPSIDSVGFLAPSVADVRVASAIIPDWAEPPDPSPPVLGVPEPAGSSSTVDGGWRVLPTHLETLRRRGFELRRSRLPWDDTDARRLWGMRVGDLLHAEMAIAHAPWYDRFEHLYRPRTAEGVRIGRRISSDRLRECRDMRAVLAQELRDRAASEGIDGWICPSTREVAPVGYQETGDSALTGFWSYAGFPAISLPVFEDPEQMPLGVQLVTFAGRDEHLLGWAARAESALNA